MRTALRDIPLRLLRDMSMAETHDYLRARHTRRQFLKGMVGAGAAAAAGPLIWVRPARAADPTPAGLHVNLGSDARKEITVSWSTSGIVDAPRLEIGPNQYLGNMFTGDTCAVDGVGTALPSRARSRASRRAPPTPIAHSTATIPAAPGTFTTAPSGKTPFRFCAMGDMGVNADAAAITSRIVEAQPDCVFMVGDLCYADRLGGALPLVDYSGTPLQDLSLWDAWLRADRAQRGERAVDPDGRESRDGGRPGPARLRRIPCPDRSSGQRIADLPGSPARHLLRDPLEQRRVRGARRERRLLRDRSQSGLHRRGDSAPGSMRRSPLCAAIPRSTSSSSASTTACTAATPCTARTAAFASRGAPVRPLSGGPRDQRPQPQLRAHPPRAQRSSHGRRADRQRDRRLACWAPPTSRRARAVSPLTRARSTPSRTSRARAESACPRRRRGRPCATSATTASSWWMSHRQPHSSPRA